MKTSHVSHVSRGRRRIRNPDSSQRLQRLRPMIAQPRFSRRSRSSPSNRPTAWKPTSSVRKARSRSRWSTSFPDRMRQVAILAADPKPVETILVDGKAWTNEGEGWIPLTFQHAEQLIEQMRKSTKADPEAVGKFECMGTETVDGKTERAYKSKPMLPGGMKTPDGKEVETTAQNDAVRIVYVDTEIGPARRAACCRAKPPWTSRSSRRSTPIPRTSRSSRRQPTRSCRVEPRGRRKLGREANGFAPFSLFAGGDGRTRLERRPIPWQTAPIPWPKPLSCPRSRPRHAKAHRHRLHPHHRSGAHHHRASLRVRLFGDAGLQSSQGRGLPDHPGQLQSGDDHDRSGAGGRHLHRADHARDRRQDHRRGAHRAGPTTSSCCCRPWADRRRSTRPWRWRSKAS